MYRPLLLSLLLTIACVLPLTASADREAEHATLALILQELKVIHSLIDQAQGQAEPQARVRFQYDVLRRDPARVEAGIEDHLSVPRVQPRRFPPLSGDYRR